MGIPMKLMSGNECRSCGAPRGELITRRIKDPQTWALDVDLSDDYPETWGPAHRVEIIRGRCKTCRVPINAGIV